MPLLEIPGNKANICANPTIAAVFPSINFFPFVPNVKSKTAPVKIKAKPVNRREFI